MLIKHQITLPFIVTLCFAKCIIGTQSGWYFPPFDGDKLQRKPRGHGYHYSTTLNGPDGQDQETSFSNDNYQSNSILSNMERIKNFADYQSNLLSSATTRANELEYRLASAVDLTRRHRMPFFYGLILQSYNYIKDLRIKGQKMVKDIRKQVNRLTRFSRKANDKKYKLNSQMEMIEKLMVSSNELENKINHSVDEFNDILEDFMTEVYKKKSRKFDAEQDYPVQHRIGWE